MVFTFLPHGGVVFLQAQLQQALLSSLTGNPGISANLSQIAAQHQLQQQLQQQLLLSESTHTHTLTVTKI